MTHEHNGNKSNLKKKILDIADIKEAVIHVKEWNLDLTIRALSAIEHQTIQIMLVEQEPGWQIRTVAFGVVSTDTGERLFSDMDLTALGKKSIDAIEYIYDQIAKLSGMREGDIERAQKN